VVIPRDVRRPCGLPTGGARGAGFALVAARDGGTAAPVGRLVGSRLELLGPGEARPLACEAKRRGGGGNTRRG
jgi:hypothetical protein